MSMSREAFMAWVRAQREQQHRERQRKIDNAVALGQEWVVVDPRPVTVQRRMDHELVERLCSSLRDEWSRRAR